jgi:redox-sensitive bicupin YhaK (pirin superfamily)
MDPDWMGFRSLRVINEDVIAARMGFGEHPHRDMEIITYPISGAVRHRDSLGHEEDIVPGMIQHMSAGSGIRHSEFNPLDAETHLLQIWIEPRERGIAPGHQSRAFPIHDERNTLHLLASHDGEGGSVRIETDARMFAGVFDAGSETRHEMREFTHAWVQVVRGEVRVNGERIVTGDGIALGDFDAIEFKFDADTELIVFELA